MIKTWSKFNYGIQITSSNNTFPFSEGGPELNAVIESGDYTIGEFAQAVATSLTGVGALEYTATLDRSNNRVTLSATGVFSILLSSGTSIGTSYADLLGFSQTADLTGSATYTGAERCGVEYYPQFLLQSYVRPEHFIKSADATINKAASGRVEVVRFGVEKFIEMDIKFITDLPMDDRVIKNNPNGVSKAVSFLTDVTQKNKFEFVPDIDQPDVYYKVIVESTQGYQDDTGFKLRELYSQNLPDIFETGVIRLRVV